MDLGFFDVRLNRIETPVAGPVQRKKTLLIGSAYKDALAVPSISAISMIQCPCIFR